MGLRLKFNLIILVVFSAGFAAAAYLVQGVLLENAKQEVALNARIMLEAAKSARSYTVKEVRPLLHQIKTDEFLPQTVPAYSATVSMGYLRKNFPDYTYKEAVLNPTNPEHKATSWEEDVIQHFRNHEEIDEYMGVRNTATGQQLFLGRPFKITNPGCLTCHGEPKAAPVSMLNRYGNDNGFGWKMNEIVGAQLVNVPMTIPLQRANDAFFTFMIILGVVFITIWLVLNFMLHVFILKRIANIAEKAENIAKGDMTAAEFPEGGKDEVDSLGHSFNLMYRSLCSAVKLLDRTQAR